MQIGAIKTLRFDFLFLAPQATSTIGRIEWYAVTTKARRADTAIQLGQLDTAPGNPSRQQG